MEEPTLQDVLKEMGFPLDFLSGHDIKNFHFDPAPLKISSQNHKEWNGACEYQGGEYLIGFDKTENKYRVVWGPAGDIPNKTPYKDDPRKLKPLFKEMVQS